VPFAAAAAPEKVVEKFSACVQGILGSARIYLAGMNTNT